MNILEILIARMSTDERRLFRQYLHRQRSDRKDLLLFDQLVKSKSFEPDVFSKQVYGFDNRNAYHSLRKRLLLQIKNFLTSQPGTGVSEMEREVQSFLRMARYMIGLNEYKAAQYFLIKAEALALSQKFYTTLDAIYNLMVSYADELELDLKELSARWRANTLELENRQKLNMAYSTIRMELSNAKSEGTTIDPEPLIQKTFRSFKITPSQANSAEFMHRLCVLVRSALASTKDYFRLEPFLLRIYNRLKNAGVFTEVDKEFELGFLYMIVHVLYRNRKFAQCFHYLEIMSGLMPIVQFKKSAYYMKYLSILAVVESFTGNNARSIQIVKSALKDGHARISMNDRFNLQVNLAVYYFQQAQFKWSLEVLDQMGHSDQWLEQRMGKEWRFKKNLIELLLQIELGRYESAVLQLRRMKKYYSKFFEHALYERAKVFLEFIEQLIHYPDVAKERWFFSAVENARMGWAEEREDIQAIAFFVWLKSKMTGIPYYEELLSVVGRSE